MSNKFKKLLSTALVLLFMIALSITVMAEDTFTISGSDTINVDNSTLKLRALLDKTDVTTSSVWYIVSGEEYAFINSDGVLTPLSNGTVTVKASYTDASNIIYETTKTIAISNQTDNNREAYVSIGTGSVGYIIRDKGLATEKNLYGGLADTYPLGTKFNLTAHETKYEFLYWKDVYSSRILTTDKTYEFTVGSDVSIHAVFRSSPLPDGTVPKFVMFQNENGYIIQNEYVNSGNVTIPQRPSIPGHTFYSWTLDGAPQTFSGNKIDASTITGDRIYIASYTQQASSYTVNVSGGSGSGNYKYNDSVKVVLDTKSIPENMFFSCWARDGKAVSYDEVYIFNVSGNTDIYAVYSDSPSVHKAPLITMSTPFISGKNITFISERNLPLDYEFIETGILINMNSSFDLYETGVSQLVSQSKSGTGQFSVRKKNSSSGITRYAKAYMIYKKDGIVHTVYSNLVSVTL